MLHLISYSVNVSGMILATSIITVAFYIDIFHVFARCSCSVTCEVAGKKMLKGTTEEMSTSVTIHPT